MQYLEFYLSSIKIMSNHFNRYLNYITIALLNQSDSWKEKDGGLAQGTRRYFNKCFFLFFYFYEDMNKI